MDEYRENSFWEISHFTYLNVIDFHFHSHIVFHDRAQYPEYYLYEK